MRAQAFARVTRVTREPDNSPLVELEVAPADPKGDAQAVMKWACERFGSPFPVHLDPPPADLDWRGLLRELDEAAVAMGACSGMHPSNIVSMLRSKALGGP